MSALQKGECPLRGARDRGEAVLSDPADAFRDAIAATGMEPPLEIRADGLLHRFSPSGKRNDNAGWYILHLDGVPAGSFGNWRDGYSQSWCASAEQQIAPHERRVLAKQFEAMRRQRDAQQRQRQAKAAAAADLRWATTGEAGDHPYLSAKGVRAHGVRIDGDDLLVPLRDAAGKLHSLQTIRPDGSKRFLPGGRVKGLYHLIGRPSGKLAICEGYATGATIHEDTDQAVAVAFNAGNLLPVARALRAKYPCLIIIIAADDDWKTVGNPGLTKATEAARAVGGLLAVPNFTGLPRGDKDTDFNDLHRLAGSLGGVL